MSYISVLYICCGLLQEMARRANGSSGEVTPMNPSRHKLNVFCVSSVGYLCLKQLLHDVAGSVSLIFNIKVGISHIHPRVCTMQVAELHLGHGSAEICF